MQGKEGRFGRFGTQTPLALSALAAIVGFGLLEVYKARFEASVRGGALLSVVHVGRSVGAGKALEREDLTVDEVPARYAPRRGVRAAELDDVVGVRVRTALAEGDVLLFDDLSTSARAERELSTLVPDGLRAVPVAASTFEGLLRPGDRVDVLSGADGSRGSRVVVERTLVLAVGGNTSRQAEGAASGSVVLAVGSKDARALAEASGRGTFILALRNPLDLTTTGDVVAEGSSGVSSKSALPAPSPKPEVERVR